MSDPLTIIALRQPSPPLRLSLRGPDSTALPITPAATPLPITIAAFGPRGPKGDPGEPGSGTTDPGDLLLYLQNGLT